MGTKVFLEVSAGNKTEYDRQNEAYEQTKQILKAKGANYGLPTGLPEELDENQIEILRSIWESEGDYASKVF
jgi:hypothetical protein